MCTFNTLRKTRMMSASLPIASWWSTLSIAEIVPSAGLNMVPASKPQGMRRQGLRKNETRASQRATTATTPIHHPNAMKNQSGITRTTVIINHCFQPYFVSVTYVLLAGFANKHANQTKNDRNTSKPACIHRNVVGHHCCQSWTNARE